MSVYKGRGYVKLDGTSVGNVPALSLRIRTQEFLRYGANTDNPTPTLDALTQVPERIEVQFTIPEYLAANLRALTGGAGSGGVAEIVAGMDQEYEITFDGVNCQTETDFDFVGYKFVPLASTDLGLIEDGFPATELVGVLLADSSKSGAGISKYGKFTVS